MTMNDISTVRWDPNREDHLFFRQSASLYAAYYYLQIMVHRPFASSPRSPSRFRFPSLAIVTTAARSCCHILQKANQRGIIPFPPIQVSFQYQQRVRKRTDIFMNDSKYYSVPLLCYFSIFGVESALVSRLT
jgi:hypothetical protein